jgi:hypothetical protein
MTRRADTILQILAEGRTLQQRVMIVLAHPDDEKIGMRTQLCQLRDALLLQATDGAPHEGHSDHDAGAFVVRAAGRLIAFNRRSRSAIIEMTASGWVPTQGSASSAPAASEWSESTNASSGWPAPAG